MGAASRLSKSGFATFLRFSRVSRKWPCHFREALHGRLPVRGEAPKEFIVSLLLAELTLGENNIANKLKIIYNNIIDSIIRRGIGFMCDRRLYRSILAALACALFCAACTPKQFEWDERFVEYFHPDAAVQTALKESVQDVRKEARYEDATLRLTQTLGNKKTLFLAVDIIIPGIAEKITDIGVPILPNNVYLFSGAVSQNQIKGLTIEEICETYKNNMFHATTTSLLQSAADDTLSYIFCFDVPDEGEIENDITLLVDGLAYTDANETKDITSRIFPVSWKASNHGAILNYELADEDGVRGSVELSDFALKIKLTSSDYKDFDALLDDLLMFDTDGNELRVSSAAGGSLSAADGSAAATLMFNEIMLTERIGKIQIGNMLVEIHA